MFSKIKIMSGLLRKRLVLMFSKNKITLQSGFILENLNQGNYKSNVSFKKLFFILFKKNKKLENNNLNLNKISIALWYEVLENGNISLIPNCTPEIFEKLYDDFFLKLDNNEAKSLIQKNFNKRQIALKINIITNSYENLVAIYNNGSKLENAVELEQKIIKTLNLLHPKTKITGTIENKLSIIEKLLIINKNDFERIEIKETQEKSNNLMESIVNLELSLNITIDIDKTSVEKYIYYIKQAKLKSKALENGRN